MVYIPLILAALITMLFAYKIWFGADANRRQINSRINSNHPVARWNHVQVYGTLYAICSTIIFVVVGARLNARLSHSAIHPTGGTLHWSIFNSPVLLLLIHSSTLCLLLLKQLLWQVSNHSTCEGCVNDMGLSYLMDDAGGK